MRLFMFQQTYKKLCSSLTKEEASQHEAEQNLKETSHFMKNLEYSMYIFPHFIIIWEYSTLINQREQFKLLLQRSFSGHWHKAHKRLLKNPTSKPQVRKLHRQNTRQTREKALGSVFWYQHPTLRIPSSGNLWIQIIAKHLLDPWSPGWLRTWSKIIRISSSNSSDSHKIVSFQPLFLTYSFLFPLHLLTSLWATAVLWLKAVNLLME